MMNQEKLLRVSSGTLRGKGLFSPFGQAVRPTTGRVKQSLFNILRFRLPGAVFLEVFSGTGQMGIEAISNGAASVTFVDSDTALTKKNLSACGCTEKATVLQGSFEAVLTALARQNAKFDIIFADPPYKSGLYEQLLFLSAPLLKPDGVLIAEHDTAMFLDSTVLKKVDERVYGRRTLTFFGGRHENSDLSGQL